MDFQDLVVERHSVRAYRPDPVGPGAVERILEIVRAAPSAANRQAFALVTIGVRGREAELRRAYDKDWFVEAPLVIAVCAIPAVAWVREADGWNAAETDAAIAMTHLVLAAAAEGLGTCWIASFDAAAVRELLGLPDGVVPFALTPLGHPADEPGPRERKPVESLLHEDRW